MFFTLFYKIIFFFYKIRCSYPQPPYTACTDVSIFLVHMGFSGHWDLGLYGGIRCIFQIIRCQFSFYQIWSLSEVHEMSRLEVPSRCHLMTNNNSWTVQTTLKIWRIKKDHMLYSAYRFQRAISTTKCVNRCNGDINHESWNVHPIYESSRHVPF